MQQHAKVLILSSLLDDPHAAAVHTHLQTMGVQADSFRYDEFLGQCQITFRPGAKTPLCIIYKNGQLLDLNSYTAVWHRRPGRIHFQAGKFPEPWVGEMVQQEARKALDGMLLSLRCLWVNYPRNDVNCMQKLWQLEVAKEIGFAIPETVITNNPELVRQFFADCKGEVIYKLIGETTNFSIPAYEMPRGVSTLPLREEDLKHIDQVKHAPHLFQQRINKAYDVRVTVVGKQIFAIRIDSQSGRGQVDWRHDYSVAMEPIDLPADLSARIFDLMRKLGLNYGALDFCLTAENDFVFLEINCAGQYLWIERQTELPISLTMAKLLAGQAEPLHIHRP